MDWTLNIGATAKYLESQHGVSSEGVHRQIPRTWISRAQHPVNQAKGVKDPDSKNKVGNKWGKIPEAASGVHKYTHGRTHLHTLTCLHRACARMYTHKRKELWSETK